MCHSIAVTLSAQQNPPRLRLSEKNNLSEGSLSKVVASSYFRGFPWCSIQDADLPLLPSHFSSPARRESRAPGDPASVLESVWAPGSLRFLHHWARSRGCPAIPFSFQDPESRAFSVAVEKNRQWLGFCSSYVENGRKMYINSETLNIFHKFQRDEKPFLFFKDQIYRENVLLISFKFYLFIYLWLCWVFVSVRGLSPVLAGGGHSSSQCAGLSLSRPLLLRSTGSRRAGSVIVAHRPSCSVACGIFQDQGSNPCPPHWQADS